MQRTRFLRIRIWGLGDVLVLLLLGAVIFGVVSLARQWRSEFQPLTEISLSVWALPRYAFFSAARGLAAYAISLFFTLIVGYAAARSRRAERIILPALDVLQSIPVLGFLPGLVLGLVALFPGSNMGLELAAIIMIFTGQVWNMTFAFYGSLKSIPTELMEASTMMGLSMKERFKRLEFPFSAVNLAWNSLMSMAGGWFFLSVCEAFTLGDKSYRLPGVGAYMAEAEARGDATAMILGIAAMVGIILGLDFLIWRPILVWVQRFRLEDNPDATSDEEVPEALIRLVFRKSRILHWVRVLARRWVLKPLKKERRKLVAAGKTLFAKPLALAPAIPRQVSGLWWKIVLALVIAGLGYASVRLFGTFRQVAWVTWWSLIQDTLWTAARVVAAVILSTLWTVPVGVWIARSPKRLRRAQPVIQVLASFPAPMLYPLVLGILFHWHVRFDFAAMFLMLLGVQWYILFNVVAGAIRTPQVLKDVLSLSDASRWTQWHALWLPSIFPALVTGWVTAAGGAWNASIVAESLSYNGTVQTTRGLGATISMAASRGDFALLAASIAVMVVVVILVNRLGWRRLYAVAQTRYRLVDV
ncbi:MAG: ABC transporter permease subunit [Pseudomonadota bacterium]